MRDPVARCRWPEFPIWKVIDGATQINNIRIPAVGVPPSPVAS
ncbi:MULTISPECIES: hypothetical protein [Mycolicibacterium]|uniref:Uncharacterized protein n=1 Tax=Mycolicibacterium austroafricanum TaxID=39687 RepID=A0ABT8HMY9_MYCAO|nr:MULTISPECIES: hypothetical protein [Mycolicibacterium]MDN4522115.1 hypothetical protein [Mycolicibacterium austroafricanum]MDW5612915.1 hypothetical protein [Mycolicibacterium sp. D5.8-2]